MHHINVVGHFAAVPEVLVAALNRTKVLFNPNVIVVCKEEATVLEEVVVGLQGVVLPLLDGGEEQLAVLALVPLLLTHLGLVA